MDVVKQRLQVQKQSHNAQVNISHNYKGSMDAVKQIIKEDGFRGLFRGLGAGLLTFGPYVSLYFAFYEQFKLYCANQIFHSTVQSLPFYVYLSSAALAGSLSAAVTCPLDVAKTRIQVQSKQSQQQHGGIAQQLKYRNTLQALGVIVREEGYSALLRGIKPRILWMAGGTTVTMVACKYKTSILFTYNLKHVSIIIKTNR